MRRDKESRRVTFINILKQNTSDNILSLEIGVAAGDFSNQLLKTLSIREHHMVDPWISEGDETRSQWFTNQTSAENSYKFVQERFKNFPTQIIRDYSHNFLINELRSRVQKYDLIYIDGDHHAEAVYLDLVLSWEILKPGGILAGDDYNWKSKTTNKMEVKMGAIKFEQTYSVKFNIVKGNNGLDQFWLKK